MAANGIPVAAPPPGAAPVPEPKDNFSPNASIPFEASRELSSRERIRLGLVTALGATLGFLTGIGLFSELRDLTALELFALRVAIAGLAAFLLFDPGMELLQDHLQGKRTTISGSRKIFSVLAIAVVTVVISLFHESLGASIGIEISEKVAAYLKSAGNSVFDKSFLDKLGAFADNLKTPAGGLELALAVFILVGVVAGAVSHWWVKGASKQPPRAALYGGAATAIGVVYLALALIFWTLLRIPEAIHSRSAVVAGIFLFALAWFLGPALLGGFSIDKYSLRHGLSLRSFLAMALSPALFGLLLVAAYELKLKNAFVIDPRWLFLPIAALVCQNLGWALALHLRTEASEQTLQPLEAVTAGPSVEQTNIGTVIPFRAADGTAELDAGNGLTATKRAKDLVLRPKGDRLWATVALVLALITSALAFYIGYFVTDPEIVVNIQQNFYQDSGLRRAGLHVYSSGRLVTLTGVVYDEAERAEALQKASTVRGVKQIIDRIQVASQPLVTPVQTPVAVIPEPVVPAVPPPPSATISVVVPTGTAKGSAQTTKKPGTVTKPEAQKHGFFHLPKKDALLPAENGANKQPDAKTDNSKKQGFFHFLKKKDKADNPKPDNSKKNKTPNTVNHQ